MYLRHSPKRNNMRILILLALSFAFSLTGFAQKGRKKNKSDKTELRTELDTVNYCLGLNIGSTVKKQGFEGADYNLIMKGILAGTGQDSAIFAEEDAAEIINAYFKKKYMERMKENELKSKKWMDENSKKDGVVTTSSGLQYTVLREGTGATPKETDKVKVHYHGTLTDGTVFDSSVDRGEPVEFPVNGVIQGWQEALQLMKTGCKWRLFIPPALGYGERGAGELIGPNVALVFDVELLDIVTE